MVAAVLPLEMITSMTTNRSVSIRCVAGEAGIYNEVIPVDLEKAVEAVCSVITGGHLSF
jgi:hypothetical protein